MRSPKLIRIVISVAKGRSPKWPALVDKHLGKQPECQACVPGKKQRVQVHHIAPVALFKNLELSEKNLITLCKKHHFIFGHRENWRKWNDHVIEDAAFWRSRLVGVTNAGR